MEARRLNPIDAEWLQERKEILQKIKGQVQLYLGPESKSLQDYAFAYKADMERPWTATDMAQLLYRIENSSVVFGGDFHTFAQSQRAHLRILRQLQRPKKVTLGLEIFPTDVQHVVDGYLAGSYSEEDFLKKINWDRNWGFPWSFYKPLMDFAIENDYSILCLNKVYKNRSGKTLKLRDKYAALQLKEAYEKQKEGLFYVIFGDLHMAQGHLPSEFLSHFDHKPPKTVTLYLNPEKVYFELAEQGLESQIEVVRYSEEHYCVLSSPPWVKWQNYLMYLEESYDQGLDEDGVEYTDHVSSLVKMIGKGLGIEVDVNDIQVFSGKDHQVLRQAKKVLEERFHDYAKFLVYNDMSFYVPEKNFFYLAKTSVNHAASLAAQYVHAKLDKRTKLLWDQPENFLPLVWVEAMGFLLSKWVNPKRKAQTLADLKKQLAAFHPEDLSREPLLLALDHKMYELLRLYQSDEPERRFTPREKSSYVEAARFLGAMLGDKYFHLYNKNKINRSQVLELLSFNPSQAQFDEFYFQQLKFLDTLEMTDGTFE